MGIEIQGQGGKPVCGQQYRVAGTAVQGKKVDKALVGSQLPSGFGNYTVRTYPPVVRIGVEQEILNIHV